ncbi:MAG: hypothetical protein PHC28_18060 [Flavobacterium sp.]|uniref:hypothetical protein n=1 Tax=Flavobacterium sp. TaxID=239 RepID=UPI0026341314|nr:hypothetical protein [Flavobacterium sp.]MDD5152352.1 hypothetical protein [Flavobacterium sp.]
MAKEPFAAKLTTLWMGGLFFWVIKGFRGNINNQLIQEFESRNLWTGYIISVIFILTILYVIYH